MNSTNLSSITLNESTTERRDNLRLNLVQTLTLTFDGFLLFPAMLLNAVLIFLIRKCKKLRTFSYFMIGTLGLLDSLSALSLCWMDVVGLLTRSTELEWLTFNYVARGIVSFYLVGVPLLAIIISVNRYLCIAHKIKCDKIFTLRKTGVMITLIISCGLLNLFIDFYCEAYYYDFDSMHVGFQPGILDGVTTLSQIYLVLYAVTSLLIAIMAVTTSVLSVLTISTIRKHMKALQKNMVHTSIKKSDIRLSIQFIVVILFLVVMYVTAFFLTYVSSLDVNQIITRFTHGVNVIINPLIYFGFTKILREELMMALCRPCVKDVVTSDRVSTASGESENCYRTTLRSNIERQALTGGQSNLQAQNGNKSTMV